MHLSEPKPTISFRVIHDKDRDFLKSLYASTREWEFEYSGWTKADIAQFLDGQFEAQDTSYKTGYPGAVFRIIQIGSTDIGRLYVDRQSDCLRVIDLTLAPDWCGRGIGTDILRSLLNEAHGGKVPVRLSVRKQNPALRLYQRHGFTITGDLGHYHALEWQPPTGPREI